MKPATSPSRTSHAARVTFKDLPIGDVDFMDVSPKQIVSVATALIPSRARRCQPGADGLEHAEEAVPLLVAESPIVGTGMGGHAARNSGEMVLARKAGIVVKSAGRSPRTTSFGREDSSGQDSGIGILVRPDDGGPDQWYGVHKFVRSNQGTCLRNGSPFAAAPHRRGRCARRWSVRRTQVSSAQAQPAGGVHALGG